MLLFKRLAAASAFGLLSNALATTTQCCGKGACGKAVLAMDDAEQECSSQLIHTVTVTPTSTAVVANTDFRTVTSDITITSTESSTDHQTLTSLATSTFISTVTATQTVALTSTVFATVTATASSTATVTVSFVPPPVKRTAHAAADIPVPPSVQHVCNARRYVRACRCIGVRPATVTHTAAAITNTVRYTTTPAPALQTNTQVIVQTSVTTVFSTITITHTLTQFATATETFSTVDNTVTSLQTVVVVPTATVTAVNPPQCTGTGFNLRFSPATTDGRTNLGLVHSIGQGLLVETYSGKGSQFSLHANGQLTAFYGNDFKALLLPSTANSQYFQVVFESDRLNVHYTGKTTLPVSCTLGQGPDYQVQCLTPGSSQPLVLAICSTPWKQLFVHYAGASTTGMTCIDVAVNALCG